MGVSFDEALLAVSLNDAAYSQLIAGVAA